jgi:hypothetical protein
MKNYYITITLIAISTIMFGCDKVKNITGSEVSLVKGGTLEIDKSLTVGQAMDNYKYFKKTTWDLVKTDNGKKIVTVIGMLDTEKHPAINQKEGVKSAEMKFEFKINQDKTFEVGWCGLAIEKNDGSKNTPAENVNLQMCLNSLKSIYNNNPDF